MGKAKKLKYDIVIEYTISDKELYDKIVEILKESPYPLTTQEIYDELHYRGIDVGLDRVRKRLYDLKEKGIIVVVKNGYCLRTKRLHYDSKVIINPYETLLEVEEYARI